jgi:hypothetical protein
MGGPKIPQPHTRPRNGHPVDFAGPANAGPVSQGAINGPPYQSPGTPCRPLGRLAWNSALRHTRHGIM